MDIKVSLNNLRMSPKKTRWVVDLVRGLDANKALEQLRFAHKKASLPLAKLVKSAMANAEHNYGLDKNNLYIKEARVDEAGMLKRWTPKAHGRATPVRSRLCHVTLVLGEIKESGIREAKKRAIEAPISLEEMAKKGQAVGKAAAAKEDKKREIGGAESGAGKKGFVSKIFNRKSGNS